jgi:hypothetical protein
MAKYIAAKGGGGGTIYLSDEGDGDGDFDKYWANDDAEAGEDGFVVIQKLTAGEDTVLDLGLFIRG